MSRGKEGEQAAINQNQEAIDDENERYQRHLKRLGIIAVAETEV